MKRIILIATILMFALGAKAQIIGDGIKINDLSVSENGDNVNISFTVAISNKAISRANTFVFAPNLTDGTYRVSMPAVVVYGKGTKLIQERNEWVAGQIANYAKATYTENGKSVRYTATIPAQRWMDGANLKIESVLGGCCTYQRQNDVVIAEKINLKRTEPERVIIVEPIPEPVWIPVSVADSLSTAFTFVVPDSEFDPNEPFKIYDDERESSLIIYFRVAKYDIVRDYMDNAQTLQNLTMAINMIKGDSKSKINRIVVAGFASPEGNFEFNDRLAFERGVSVKEYLMKNCGLKDNDLSVFNGSVDWRGLRSMVAKSNLPEKTEILNIIDNTPIGGSATQPGRLEALKKLNDGKTYAYLLNEYFPYLRNGAFIKVYYENN